MRASRRACFPWQNYAPRCPAGAKVRSGFSSEFQGRLADTIETVEVLTGEMSRAELILRYTLAHPHCDTTIIGTCNPHHFSENQRALQKGPLPDDLYREVTRRVHIQKNGTSSA